MIRAKRVYFCTSKSDLDRLFECNRESAQVWNECLHLSKEYYVEQGELISKSELQTRTKGRFHLHSQSTQAVCHKYIFARTSAYQATQKGIPEARYPYKEKSNYNTKWAKDGFKIFPNGRIELSMGIHDGKREKPIVVYASNLPEGKIKEMELCYDQHLYLSISFDDGIENTPYIPQQAVGVDLGEIHTIAAFCEDGQALIVTGRKVRSIHQLRNKKLAEIQRLQSKCKKGSRRWKRLEKAKRYVLSKSAKQLEDALHKTTRQFVEWCVEQSISDVHVGNPEGVQRNTRKKKKATKKQAQKLSNWSFGRVKKYLEYKLAQAGKKLHEVDEAYTSQTCPVCKKRKKVSSRNYVCECGYKEHRDVHGGRNILSKAMYGEIAHFDKPTILKYLRIAA
jgi:putative transposase